MGATTTADFRNGMVIRYNGELYTVVEFHHVYIFMNTETFDQQPVPKEMLGNAVQFLKEQDIIELLVDGENIISVELPNFLELKVESAEPGVRGDTANNVTKPATLETGAVINVPLFVNPGDRIRVDTRTGQYVERVK